MKGVMDLSSGGCAALEKLRRYPISKGREAPARLQALVWQLRGPGVTLRRYPASKDKGEAPTRW